MRNVTISKKALHRERGVMSFNHQNAGWSRLVNVESNIIPKGTSISEVSLCSLDEEIDEKITFIKMDVEGAEMDALMGTKRTIQRHRPKLAISLYHKISDIWEIPALIHHYVPTYKLYIRHHALWTTPACMSEVVLYAVE